MPMARSDGVGTWPVRAGFVAALGRPITRRGGTCPHLVEHGENMYPGPPYMLGRRRMARYYGAPECGMSATST
jgi:hypothetical protein